MRQDLTEDDIARLDSVRRRIWVGGYAGFAAGGGFGLANCLLLKFARKSAMEFFPKDPMFRKMPLLQNKHLVMWSLVAGACGMFLGAGSEGIRASESLRDVYDRKAKSEQELTLPQAQFPPDAPEYHVARASADSHARRMEAIKASKERGSDERDGTPKSGAFKAW